LLDHITYSFIFVSLFENRDLSKTLAFPTQKISNFGYELLIIFDTSGNYPRLIFKLSLKEFKFKFEFGHAHPSHVYSFFLSFSSIQTDLGETYPAFLPAALTKS
jgi:hypothetical protein